MFNFHMILSAKYYVHYYTHSVDEEVEAECCYLTRLKAKKEVKGCTGNQSNICLILNCTESPLSHVVPAWSPFPFPVAFRQFKFWSGHVCCAYSELLDISLPIHDALHSPAFPIKMNSPYPTSHDDLENPQICIISGHWITDYLLAGDKAARGSWNAPESLTWPKLWKSLIYLSSVQFSSVTQSCLTLCDPMSCQWHQASLSNTNSRSLPKLISIKSVMPSNHLILSSPSTPTFNLSQHQDPFKWVSSSHQVAEVLEFQLHHRSFQWTPRTDLL